MADDDRLNELFQLGKIHLDRGVLFDQRIGPKPQESL